jgi:hypothetical protein
VDDEDPLGLDHGASRRARETLPGAATGGVTPKYWNRPAGAEPILQVRAAVLSEDERLTRYFAQRPGNPYRRRKAG